MFGQSKPVIFDPYGRRRSRRAVPRWLVLLIVGAAAGVGGVLYVQERHLPPRLSAQESTQLKTTLEQTQAERQRLEQRLADTVKRLDAALADRKTLADQAATARDMTQRLRSDLESVVASLPPDPRGGVIQVRAARFDLNGEDLRYDVVLSRDRAGNKAMGGVMQLVVAGVRTKNGPESTVSTKPVPISVGSYESLRGAVTLPVGFMPRQTTIKLLDRADGKLLGMRVINVS